MKLLISLVLSAVITSTSFAQADEGAERFSSEAMGLQALVHAIHTHTYEFIVYYDLVNEIATRDISREDAMAKRARLSAEADDQIAEIRNQHEALIETRPEEDGAETGRSMAESRAHALAMVVQFEASHRYWDNLVGSALDRAPSVRSLAQQQMRGQLLSQAIAYQDVIQAEIAGSPPNSVAYWYFATVAEGFRTLEEFNRMLFSVAGARGQAQRQLQWHYQTELAAIVGNGQEALTNLRAALEAADPQSLPVSLEAFEQHMTLLQTLLEGAGAYTSGFLDPNSPMNAVDEVNHLLAIEEMLLQDHEFRLARLQALETR